MFGMTRVAVVCEGRAIVVDLHGSGGERLCCASIYLETGAGLHKRNLGILSEVGAEIRARGGSYIIGGDWQSTPEKLG